MHCLLLLIPLAGGVLGVALPGPNVPKVMTKHVNYEPPYENNYYNEYQYYEEYYYGPGGQTAYAVLPGSTRRIPGSVTTTAPPTAPSDEPQETPPVDFLPEIDSGFWFDEYLDEYFGYYDFSDDSFPAALQDFAPGLSSYNTNDFDDDDLPPTIIIGGQQFDTTSRYCLQPPCDDADAALNDDEGEEEEDGGDARDNIVPRSPQQGLPPVQGLPPLDPKNFATTQDLIFEIAVRQETEREYQLWKASRAPPKQPQNLNDRLSAPGIEMLERASFRAAAIARLEEAKAAKASQAGQSSAAAAASASASQAQSEAAADKSKADAASAAAATGDTAKAVQIALDKKTPPVLPGTGAVVQIDSKIEPLVIGKKVAEAASAPLSRADKIKALHDEAKRQAQKAASIPKPSGIVRRAASPQASDVDDPTPASSNGVNIEITIDNAPTTFIRTPAQQTRKPDWLPGSNGGAIRGGDHDLASPSPSADPSTVNSAVFNSILSSLMNVANQPKSTSQPQSTTKKPTWLPGSNGGVVLGGGNGNLASLSRTPDPTMTNSDLLNRVLSSLKSAANQPQLTTKPWWLPGSNGGVVVVGGGNGNLASAPPSSSPSSSSSSWSTSSTSSSSTPAPLDTDSSSTSSSPSSPSSTPSSPSSSNDFDTIITALLATANQTPDSSSSPPPDFSYSLIRDITNTFFLAADDSGTLGLTSDPPTADAFASKTFALFKGALAADARRRLFVYYPATMEALGVSRFRLAQLNETAFDARAVAGVPVSVGDGDGGDGGGGVVERDGGGESGAILVPVDAEGVGYAFVVCDVVADGVTENKLFIVKDLDAGVQTLLDQATREEVTGGEVEGCWPVALRSPLSAGL